MRQFDDVVVVPHRDHPKWTPEALVAGTSKTYGLRIRYAEVWDSHLYNASQQMWFQQALFPRLDVDGFITERTTEEDK